MKTIKITILLLVVFAAIGTSFAQNSKSTMQLLTTTEWELQQRTYKVRFFEKYSESKIYGDMFYERKSNTVESDYYLSDVIPENFEKEKVGKIKNGKYIITQGKDRIKVNDYPHLYLSSFLWLTHATNSLPNRASPKYWRLNL